MLELISFFEPLLEDEVYRLGSVLMVQSSKYSYYILGEISGRTTCPSQTSVLSQNIVQVVPKS